MAIALMTDFGLVDSYVGTMKGVIASIAPQVPVIDLTHLIPPQDILGGHFCLLNSAPYFPPGTIFVGVVDPGVGTQRQAIAVATNHFFFVGPNNGLGSALWKQQQAPQQVVSLDNPKYWRSPSSKHLSHTFHGRDIFAPAAAHLALGTPLKLLGTPLYTQSLIDLTIPSCKQSKGDYFGSIQHIDHFGNLISNIPGTAVQLFRGQVKLAERTIPLTKTYGDVPKYYPCAIIGSHGWLEISLNQGSAQQFFQVERGHPVEYHSQC